MRRLLAVVGVVLAVAIGASAQFLGYVSNQSTTSTPVNNLTCTAALAGTPFLVQNIGQGAHIATALSGASPPTLLTYIIQGSYDGITFFDISDVGTGPSTTSDITGVSGYGYYPVVAVKVLACLPGAATFTLRYSAISLTPGATVGTTQSGQIIKHIANGASSGSTFSSNNNLRTPFGSSSGALYFQYLGSPGPSGSSLSVQCNSSALLSGSGNTIATFAIAQTAISPQQIFTMPAFSCPLFVVTYTSGGASAGTFLLDYVFAPAGSNLLPFQYTHVTGTTATVAKGTAPAFLHALTVNTSAAGTISIFDLATAACTGTPATNTVAVITTPAATNGLPPFLYDTNFLNGICVKASVAMDFTVSAQ
jgi:hypothetical protein